MVRTRLADKAAAIAGEAPLAGCRTWAHSISWPRTWLLNSCTATHPSSKPPTHSPTDPSIHPSIHPSSKPPTHSPTDPSIHPSIHRTESTSASTSTSVRDPHQQCLCIRHRFALNNRSGRSNRVYVRVVGSAWVRARITVVDATHGRDDMLLPACTCPSCPCSTT